MALHTPYQNGVRERKKLSFLLGCHEFDWTKSMSINS